MTAPPTSRRRPRATARRAFTLVEVALVVVIAGLLAAVAVPRYAQSLTRYSANAAAQRVIADLELARQRAAATSKTVDVVFDPAADTYAFTNLDHPDHPGTPYTVDLSADPYGADLRTADFAGRAYFKFSGYGRPDAGGTLTLGVGTHAFTIALDPDTGQATRN